MNNQMHVSRGVVAGVVGGLAASWVMNQFLAGPGDKLQKSLQSPEENARQAIEREQPQEDSTMKTADAVASTVSGGQHLTWEQKEKAGPVVHYAFGGLMGALYGGIAELWPGVRAGFGTAFATSLFTAADLIAVPALNLGPPANEQPVGATSSHLAAHLVYGVSTELVRRIARALL